MVLISDQHKKSGTRPVIPLVYIKRNRVASKKAKTIMFEEDNFKNIEEQV